jgi:hypothetical protein
MKVAVLRISGARNGSQRTSTPRLRGDAIRALSQVRGSPADSVRPGQTGRSCLGVKGSRVQIPPSRQNLSSSSA